MSEAESGELEQLLGRCAAQDPKALEQLYQRVAGILLAVVMRILRQRDLAEDALQDVFVRIWLQSRQYDQIRGRPLAWMISIARYRAIDLMRAQRPSGAGPAARRRPRLPAPGCPPPRSPQCTRAAN